MNLTQEEKTFRKIQIAALGHAAEKMPVAPLIEIYKSLYDIHFQIQAAQILLPVAPGELGGPVPGKAAGDLLFVHGCSSFPPLAFLVACIVAKKEGLVKGNMMCYTLLVFRAG